MNLGEIWNYLKAYYPALVLVIALVVVAVSIASGRRLPPTVVQYGTLLLVLVTLATVLQNGQLVKNAAEERELNRDLLIEQQKGAIIQLIVLGIDRLENELSEDWDSLEDVSKEEGGKVVLSPLPESFDPPTKRLVSDVERYYPDVVDDLEEYMEERDAYSKEYAELETELSEQIPEGLYEEIQSDLINGVMKNNSIVRNERRAVAILAGQSKLIARGAFGPPSAYGWRNEYTKGWMADNWQEVREACLLIQDDQNHSDKFATLHIRGNRLINMNTKIWNGLSVRREEIKEEYNILEPEIADAKD